MDNNHNIFKVGRSVYFRDEDFKACFGKIISVEDINDALVTLLVQRDTDGKLYTVKKINPGKDHEQEAEESYHRHGHL